MTSGRKGLKVNEVDMRKLSQVNFLTNQNWTDQPNARSKCGRTL